jgi:hypothetical protein
MSSQPDAADADASPSQGLFSWLCLTVGQVVSLLGCIAAPIATIVGIVQLRAMAGIPGGVPPGNASGLKTFTVAAALVGGVVGFCFSAAMYIVFSHVKQSRGRPPASTKTVVRFLLVLLAVALFFLLAF